MSDFNLSPLDVPPVTTKHRRICTQIPAPGTMELMRRIGNVESASAMTQLPVVWDRASGYQLFDPWGNIWIDFSSTIFVANCGHAHPHMVEKLQQCAGKLLHAYTYPTQVRADFLEKLVAFVPEPLQKVSLFSTGSEASERAIKLARLYGLQFEPKKRVVVGWDGNYHGKTMGATMAGGYHEQKHWIGYLDPNMHQLPFPYPWVMERGNQSGSEMLNTHLSSLEEKGVEANQIAAFIVESYQGWGGIFYPEDYIQALREWTRKHEILLIFDEIQSGFGRTGKLFAYEHYDVEADLVICGKGISGSLPLSAVLGRAELIDLDPAYTSTHGGNPMCCAAGLANLEIFEAENLVAESARKGELVRNVLGNWQARFPKRVGRLCGSGLLWGVFIMDATKPGELDPVFCDRILERALQKGLFNIRTGRATIKLGPPLNIPDEALLEGLEVIAQSIEELTAEDGRAAV